MYVHALPCILCSAGIPIVKKKIHTNIEARKRVTNSNTFLRGKGSLGKESPMEESESSLGYALEAVEWQMRGGHGSMKIGKWY